MHGLVGSILAVVLIVAATAVLAVANRLERPWLQAWAVLRAAVQLGLLSLVLTGVIRSLPLTFALVGVGLVVAAWTATGRAGLSRRRTPPLALLLAASVAAPAVLVFLSGALPFTARYVLALGGILTGNAMTATSLAGRTLRRDLVTYRDEVEGWLALGAPMRAATARLVRSAASTAILPGTDQTRTTGLVALPGAFVGALFGGASVAGAAQFQLIVLASILLVGVIVATTVTQLLGAPQSVPTESPAFR